MLPKVSLGAELTVCHGGCEHSTIQGAVNAAADGDTIFISGGTYSEHVTVEGKNLTIEGSGSNNTFVQGIGDGGPVFTLGTGSAGPYYYVYLSYLTVTGGDHAGGSQIGGGIQVRYGAYLNLSNVTVTDNFAQYGAGIGVMTAGGPPSTFSQCSVTNNSATEGGGGIYVIDGASVIVQQCSISNNTASVNGGGIDAEGSSALVVSGSTISGNQVPGLCSHSGCGTGKGGGVYANFVTFTMSNSVISGNSITAQDGGSGGGIYVNLGSYLVSILRSVVAQNSITGAGYGGGIFAATPTGSPSILYLNTDYIVLNTTSGAVYGAGGVQNQGLLSLTNTTITNNTLPNCSGGYGCPP